MAECRYATTDDLPALARLHVDAWRAAYAGLMPDDVLELLDERHGLTRLETVISATPPRIVVAERNGALAGFCRCGLSKETDVPPNTVEVFALNVHPDRWRLGIGGALMTAVATEASSRGYTTCTLWVLRRNTRARLFYEAAGFSLDGAERTEVAGIGHSLHEVRYRRNQSISR